MSDEVNPSGNTGKDSKVKQPQTTPSLKGGGNHMSPGDEFTDENDVDLVELSRKIWSRRKTILLITAVFTCVGIFHYLFGATEFRSEAVLIQETEGAQQQSVGNELLQQLSGNFGMMGTGSAVMATARGYSPPPIFLYPSIVHSSDFQYELIYREIEFSELGETMTLYEYFTEYHQPPVRNRVYSFLSNYTYKLPITVFRGLRNLFKSNEEETLDLDEEEVEELDDRLQSVTQQELAVINNLRSRITMGFEPGLTRISATLPDPKASAMMNVYLIERIQEYMTNYRIEKARQNLHFVQEQHQNAKERYEEAQLELARFRDQNINLTSATAQTQLAHLQDQRNLRFNVYNSLSEQVEQARLTLQEQTPVFNILEKPNIPTTPFTGASNLVLVFSIVLGLFTGIGWILIKDTSFYRKLRSRESGHEPEMVPSA